MVPQTFGRVRGWDAINYKINPEDYSLRAEEFVALWGAGRGEGCKAQTLGG